ncbi:hypothetical protein Rcae01_03471 [Novipirellula caenicola]|uniref:Uncharacterized protein n=1 Tax=Novipirellula caenicola TaxID=1536901 RepID=A0ABP9VW18_9BACT
MLADLGNGERYLLVATLARSLRNGWGVMQSTRWRASPQRRFPKFVPGCLL